MSDATFLRNTAGPLQVTFYSGETASNASGDVTVSVTGLGGTSIVAGGTATAGTAIGTGVYLYDLDPQAELDLLTAAWSGTFGGDIQVQQTTYEVQGAFHVSLSEVRAMSGLSSTTNFPTARLVAVRRWWEDLCENHCGVAFVPRHGYDVLDGTGTDRVMLSHLHPTSLRWASVDGSLVSDLSEWVLYDSGLLVRDDGGTFRADHGNVVVKYEHGHHAPPSDLKEAGLTAIRYKLLGDRSGIPERAITMVSDVGSYTLALAGANRPTGMPEVDAVLASYRERTVMVA